MKNNEKLIAPRYVAVADTIRGQIFQGEWNPGDMLPSENVFAERFSVSRETIRKSLKRLETDGYLTPQAGKGYFVSMPKHNRFIVDFAEDEEQDGCTSKLKWTRVMLPNEEISRALSLNETGRVVEICRLILRENVPCALDLKYLPYEKGLPLIEAAINYAVFPDIIASKTAPFAFHTRMELSAELAEGLSLELLNCQVGEPVLVARRYLTGKNNSRIGYGIKYFKQPQEGIVGFSGYMSKGNPVG